MKRRSFFGALIGLCAAPAFPNLPAAPPIFIRGTAMGKTEDCLFPGDDGIRRWTEERRDWRDVFEQREREFASMRALGL